MARKPARLERAGALTPRDRMWAAMRALKDFTAVEVQFLANLRRPPEEHVHIDTVETYIVALGRAEPAYVRLIGSMSSSGARGRQALAPYELVRDTGVDAPNLTSEGKPSRQALGVVRMWKAMRVLRDFTCLELAAAASAPEFVVTLDAAQNFVRHLAHGRYVTVLEKKKAGVRWRFVRSMNTGPRPPVVERGGSVVDGNTGKVVFDATGKAASAEVSQ